MKVGTLTFHKVNNFGAVLQAYALQRYINNLGCDSEIIDYSPIYTSKSQKQSKAKKILSYLINPKKKLLAKIANQKFSTFRKKNLKLGENVYVGDQNIETNPPTYDAYIVGSDQVWNTDLSNKSKAFYLHFPKTGKRISYAVSVGKEAFNDYEIKYIQKYLNDFDCISVREEQHAVLLSKMFNINVEVTLDPVFLLEKSEWNKLTKPIKRMPQKYILVYVLEYSEELIDCANKKAKELKSEIIYISLIKNHINGKVLNGIGPSEFLYVFSGATYVCTNSFHGTAFSIIFNKNFSVVRHTTRNSRIDNILEISGLKERYYDVKNKQQLDSINYDVVNRKLINVIEKSKSFIQKSLGIG